MRVVTRGFVYLHRSAALVNMGFAVEPALGQAPPMITMLKKNGKRLLENADEAMDHLQSRFPNATYHSVQGDAIASMSIKDQVGHGWCIMNGEDGQGAGGRAGGLHGMAESCRSNEGKPSGIASMRTPICQRQCWLALHVAHHLPTLLDVSSGVRAFSQLNSPAPALTMQCSSSSLSLFAWH